MEILTNGVLATQYRATEEQWRRR